MFEFLPKDVIAGLEEARRGALRRRSRLRVHAGSAVYPILRFWDRGFSLDAREVTQLRGLVEIHDSGRHVYTSLIVASEVSGDELICEMKRSTATTGQPLADWVRDENAPIALIPRY